MLLAAAPKTVASPVAFEGRGLFSSISCKAAVEPAPAGSGINFIRVDLPDQHPIRADVRHVIARPRHTVLSAHPNQPGPGVHTVEHLLCALAACGITDARVLVSGPEIPLLDGSAAPFMRALMEAGRAEAGGVGTHADPIVITQPLGITERGATIEALPTDGPWLDLEYHLDYGPAAGPLLGPQTASFRLNWQEPDRDGFLREIAPARTFCTQAEAKEFRAAGFFAHLEPQDVLVIAPDGPIGTTLRMPHEPARHKVLDMLGDLALVGRPIHGRIVARKAGHALNHAMGRALLELR